MLRITWFSGLFLALFSPVAAFSQTEDTQAVPRFEDVDAQTAMSRSAGGISLHYGIGFPEIAVIGTKELLEERGYTVEALSGGPENELVLCINTRCASKHFDITTIIDLTTVVDQIAPTFLP